MPIGSHSQPNNGLTNNWITPPEIIEALGPFDLDPCVCTPQPWKTAETMWSEGGLDRDWFGHVWLNPPYGQQTASWMARLASHGDGIALIFARTETAMFFDSVWGRAHSLLFLKGRLHFHYPDGTRAKGNSGAPSVLIAYGEIAGERLADSGLAGSLVSGGAILGASCPIA